MPKTPTLYGSALLTILALVGPADAQLLTTIHTFPGAACKPIDQRMAKNVLYNSGGVIANMSTTETVVVTCSVLAEEVFAPRAVEFYVQFLTTSKKYCVMRMIGADGSPLVSTAANAEGSALNLTLYKTEALEPVSIIVRCELPPADDKGPQGIVGYRPWTRGPY